MVSKYSESNYVNLRSECSVKYSEDPLDRHFPHVHTAYEVTLILSDDVEVTVNNTTYHVPYGSLLLFNTMDTHRIKYNGDQKYRRFVALFKPSFLSELEGLSSKLLRCFFLRSFDKSNLLCLSSEQLDETRSFYKRLISISDKEFMKAERTKLVLAEFLIHINDLYFTKNIGKLPEHYNDYSSVYKAILYIHENYSADISRKKLSTLTGLNDRTLCEYFKNITGMTTNQYILTFRLSAAKNLLLKGIQAAVVAEKTGFDNYSNFSRTFKKHIGLSPKQYAMRYSDPSYTS